MGTNLFVFLITLGCLIQLAHCFLIPDLSAELILEPLEAVVTSGHSISFLCSSFRNTSFEWNFNDEAKFYKIEHGVSDHNHTEGVFYWSNLTLTSVTRKASGEVTCLTSDGMQSMTSLLVVNGVRINGPCTEAENCITDNAICHRGSCECRHKEVLLKLTKSGREVCRKMIYRLHDPCEFLEQCSKLVDKQSMCSPNGDCVCRSWATEINGRCVTTEDLPYDRNLELYRVVLVSVTCFIVAIIGISLWITLKNHCSHQPLDSNHRPSVVSPSAPSADEIFPQSILPQINEEIMEIADDKPPSYEEAWEPNQNVSSPPNFKDALKHNMTAKRLLRQVSAPAGQLLSRASISFKRS